MEVLPGPLPDGRRSGGDEGLGSRLCRHFLCTFQDVSSYHSNAVSEVAAASHVHRSIVPEIDQLGHFKQL